MKTNKHKLVAQAVLGKIHHPTTSGARVGYDGKGVLLPGVGGITYNFQIGDNCMQLIGDHVEPGISISNSNDKENLALNFLACIGNEVVFTSGEAKNQTGVVVGIHGGVNHVMVYVDEETLYQVNINDFVRIHTYGQGLQLLDYPMITWMNIDPHLLEKMNETHLYLNDKVVFHVAECIPSYLMGAGIGETTLLYGDVDIMLQDESTKSQYAHLRFGDFVAIENFDTRNGGFYHKDYISIGVICHSDSFTAGHGPGVTIIACGHKNYLQYELDDSANLAHYYRNI